MRRVLRPLLVAALALAVLALLLEVSPLGRLANRATSGTNGPRPVVLQLKWRHQFQFAGYYAAVRNGYYAQEGLDVELREGSPAKSAIDEVTSGRADFGISDVAVVRARMLGRPVVVVSALFQHSPFVLLTRRDRGLSVPADLAGRTVMLAGDEAEIQFRALLRREGLPVNAFRVVSHTWRLEDLMDGTVDALSAYSTVEPFLLRTRGVEPTLIRPSDYGVDFYDDLLFTSEALATSEPTMVEAFRRASLRGWDYAMQHVDELAQAIVTMPGVAARGRTPELLRAEAEEMRRLMELDLVPIGHVNPGRLERMARTYTEATGQTTPPNLAGLVFTQPPPASEQLARWAIRVTAVLVPVLVVGLVWVHQLRRAVAARTTELQQAQARRDALEQKLAEARHLESLGLLAGGIAHDFNNLLQGVLGHADLALGDLPAQAPATEHVRLIEQSARRAADLTRQLLAYSGRTHIEFRPLDASALVRDTVELLAVSVGARCRLRADTPAGLPAVEADRSQLQQVVMNLVMNAAEALGEAGGDVTVRTSLVDADRDLLAQGYVDDDLQPGRYVAVEVADTGRGMPEDVRRRIFEPFFSTKSQGRGLGLAAALGIVRRHRGTMIVRSAAGAGTTFVARAPASAARVEPPAAPVGPATHAPLVAGGLVLVVDDEAGVRRVAVRMLERAGFATREASDGAEAVEMFERGPEAFRAVLLDLTMPRLGGEEALAAMRARRPAVPVVLASGYHEPEIVRRLRHDTALAFVQKPYKSEDLLARLGEVLGATSVSPPH